MDEHQGYPEKSVEFCFSSKSIPLFYADSLTSCSEHVPPRLGFQGPTHIPSSRYVKTCFSPRMGNLRENLQETIVWGVKVKERVSCRFSLTPIHCFRNYRHFDDRLRTLLCQLRSGPSSAPSAALRALKTPEEEVGDGGRESEVPQKASSPIHVMWAALEAT